MHTILVVINLIYNSLTHANDFEISLNKKSLQICTLFDDDYPQVLKAYCFQIPIIYYRGDITILSESSYVMTIDNSSFYIQKVHKLLAKTNYLIAKCDSPYSTAKVSYLCDIIYCNDIGIVNKQSAKLVVNFGLNLSTDEWNQLLSVIVKKIFVIAGYPSRENFDFLNNCIDNYKSIYALPTNIFIGSGSLPNLLLEMGVRPLILNENKGSFTCKN